MYDYVGKNMVCDTVDVDGGVRFEKEYFGFYPRGFVDPTIVIKYEDIKNIKYASGIKKRVDIITDKRTYQFYLYKANTFIQILNQARKDISMNDGVSPENDFTKKEQEPLTNEQIDKLTKLSQLHKDGVLSDEEFNKEKNLIINR